MPNSEHRPSGNIRPSVAPHRNEFRCRPDRACIPVQQKGQDPQGDPVDRRQVPFDEFERDIDRPGDAVSSDSVKRSSGLRLPM